MKHIVKMPMEIQKQINESLLESKEVFPFQEFANSEHVTIGSHFQNAPNFSKKQNQFSNLNQNTMNINISKHSKKKQHDNNLLPAGTVVRTLNEVRFLTIKEVAALTGYNDSHIRSLALNGTLKSYKEGRYRRITVEAAVQFGSKTYRTASRKNLPLEINIKGRLISKRA